MMITISTEWQEACEFTLFVTAHTTQCQRHLPDAGYIVYFFSGSLVQQSSQNYDGS
jgi:hypothetical protein